jgi:Xaa-Pro aminopeptidase
MLFNQSRAIEYMRQHNLDVLVATSPVNVGYFSDYFLWLDPLFKEYMMDPGSCSNLAQSYAVFPISGEPALVLKSLFAINAADLWVRDLHLYGDPGFDYSLPARPTTALENRFVSLLRDGQRHATPSEALVSILSSRGLADARIGLEMEGLPAQTKEAIMRALPRASIKDCSNLIRLVRAVKSAEEIKRLTRAAEINEQVAMESVALARPGKPVAELVEHYRARVAELGANFDHFAFSIRGFGICTEPNYLLTSDDVLFVDFGCIYHYYFSDTGTTLALNNLSQALLGKYQALSACLEAGSKTMRPGVKGSEIQAAMRNALKEHGITASFPHGHGLGLEIRDYPIIVPNNGLRIRDDCIDVPSDLPMEEGMINNLEAAIFMPLVGVLHMEQSFILTAEGSRQLVPQDRSKPRMPAFS